MLLDGFAVAGYRSFGHELQRFGPLNKVNLIAGQNNSGKSNALRFLDHRFGWLASRAGGGSTERPEVDPLDRHLPNDPPLQFAIGMLVGSEWDQKVTAAVAQSRAGGIFGQITNALMDQHGMVWWEFVLSTDTRQGVVIRPEMAERIASGSLDSTTWANLSSALSSTTHGSVAANAAEVVRWIMRHHFTAPRVSLIPAVRHIGQSNVSDDDLSGADIIQRLAQLQHPSIHDQHKKQQFTAINEFIKAVTGDDRALIEIPDERNTIHVHLGSQVLPLENLGTGIHEVTMLAAWATVLENQMLCIEEPEIHLHPLLQRKLLRYLAERTTNQYLITTHSAHLLDQPGASVFHVRWDGTQSEVTRAISPADRVELCADLGYRASDLLQANAVIWVEGPTDRLYLRHWLRAVDPELIEGVHYSLMFYGGRLLSHLSADDVEVEDFISLRRINQYLAIVLDSDKAKSGQRINATKRRVQAEFDKGRGFAWVTEGREIENYIPSPLLWEAIEKVRGDLIRPQRPGDKFTDVMSVKVKGRSKPVAVDKIKVAHHVTNADADLSVLDLKKQVRRLASFIRDANGMDPSRAMSSSESTDPSVTVAP